MNRRDFFNSSFLTIMALSASGSQREDLALRLDGKIFCGTSSIRKKDEDATYFLCIVDFLTKKCVNIPIEERIHSIEKIPHIPDTYIVIGQKPSHMCFILTLKGTNFQRRSILPLDDDGFFYGHGCINPHRNTFLTTEYSSTHREGIIVERDLIQTSSIKYFSSGGFGPHQIKINPFKKEIIVLNGAVPLEFDDNQQIDFFDEGDYSKISDISFLDFDGNILRQIQAENKYLSFRHLDISKSGKIAVNCFSKTIDLRSGILNSYYCAKILNPDGTSYNLLAPSETYFNMKFQSLNLRFSDNEKYLSLTSSKGEVFILFDLNKRIYKFIASIENATFLDQNQNLFLMAKDKKIFIFDPQTMNSQTFDLPKNMEYLGSHSFYESKNQGFS